MGWNTTEVCGGSIMGKFVKGAFVEDDSDQYEKSRRKGVYRVVDIDGNEWFWDFRKFHDDIHEILDSLNEFSIEHVKALQRVERVIQEFEGRLKALESRHHVNPGSHTVRRFNRIIERLQKKDVQVLDAG